MRVIHHIYVNKLNKSKNLLKFLEKENERLCIDTTHKEKFRNMQKKVGEFTSRNVETHCTLGFEYKNYKKKP